MGVHGLWRLIEPSGKPVPLETLENKILGVDVSIWLHQAIKGFQDSKGAPVPNAHLLGIYHRVCKLLYFKVKPVFIFDGGVPMLKKQTIAKRNQLKSRNISEAERLQKQLLNTLLKHSAISKVLSEKTKASLSLTSKKTSKNENLYMLPPSELDSTVSSSDEEDLETTTSDTTDSSPTKHWDLHTIDVASVHFKSLPIDVRHEILTELKETRKQSSWGKIHELPRKSDDFSIYQMGRLLKRQAVQSALEDAEKEMGGHSLSLAELEAILKDQGVVSNTNVGKRIASDENTRFLLIKDVKQAIQKAKEEESKLKSLQDEVDASEKERTDEISTQEKIKTKADLEFEEDLEKAIALSLQEEPSTSKTKDELTTDVKNKGQLSYLENFNDEDFQSDSSEEMEKVSHTKKFSSAQSYMLEYSGLTPNEISKILSDKAKNKKVLKKSKLKEIIEATTNSDKIRVHSSDECILISEEVDPITQPECLKSKEHISSNESTTMLENGLENTPSSKKTNPIEDVQNKTSNEAPLHQYGIGSTKDDETIDKITVTPILTSATTKIVTKDKIETVSTSSVNGSIEIMGTANDIEINTLKDSIQVVVKDSSKCSETEDDSIRNENRAEETIEIMSDSGDSSSSNEFLEVKDTIQEIAKDPSKCKETEEDSIRSEHRAEEAIEIMSDSGDSSSSIEFLEVSESKPAKNAIEIVIDPSENIDGDDLFEDIFEENGELKKTDALDKAVQQKLGNKIIPTEEKTNSNEEKCMLKKNILETIREEEIVSIESKESSVIATEDKYMKSTGADFKGDSVEIQDNSVKTSTKEESASTREAKIQETIRDSLNIEQMMQLKNDLQQDRIDLLVEKSTRERMAGNITDQMYQEAQDLLELFGVPYIVAPMEAEAQCAFLDAIELTDGTITDDSDIWLFGGRTVYKNFFNQSKYVMEFRAEDIKHHFKLTRHEMILLALLVGSDYTPGVQGIGPVTALEILAAFPPSEMKDFSLSHAELLSGLKEFQSWFKKGKTAGPGRSPLKNKLKNVFLTDNFPSLQVVQAYLEPAVETSREKFSWGAPDFPALSAFAKEKFGWSTKKTEEILKPVIKRVEEHRIQKTIKDYFKTVHKVQSNVPGNKMSKRVKKAIDKIGKTPEELIAEEMEALSKAKEKVTRTRKKKVETNSESENKPKRTRKQKNEGPKDSAQAGTSTKPPRKSRKKNDKPETTVCETSTPAVDDNISEKVNFTESVEEELEKYENIAMELKQRRQRKNQLSKMETVPKKKSVRPQPQPKKILPTENIPSTLDDDEEVQFLKATTSRSLKRQEEIDQEIKSELDQNTKKKYLPNFHKREVIHQKLRDKTDLLKNKLKAIEVFRKSKKGPGFIKKQERRKRLPKQDAELSENSSDE